MAQQRLNKVEWDAYYNQWKTSSMSVSAFCKANLIHYQRFCYWKQVKEGTKKRPNANKFIKLPSHVAKENVSIKSPTELVFSNGAKIIFQELPPVQYLKSLLL